MEDLKLKMGESDQTTILLQNILEAQIPEAKNQNVVAIEVEPSTGESGAEYESEMDREDFEAPGIGKKCCTFVYSHLGNIILLGIGCILLLATIAIRLQPDFHVDTDPRGTYLSAVIFVISLLFFNPVIVHVIFAGFLSVYELMLHLEWFSALSGVKTFHFFFNMVFIQVVRFAYLLLDLISILVLNTVLQGATNAELCPGNIDLCGLRVLKEAMDIIIRVTGVLVLWAACRILSKSLTVYFSKYFNNRTHRDRIRGTLNDELMLSVLVHKMPNALLVPLLSIYDDDSKLISPSISAQATAYIQKHGVDGELGGRYANEFELYSRVLGLRVFNRIFLETHPNGAADLHRIYKSHSSLDVVKHAKRYNNGRALYFEKKEFIEYFDNNWVGIAGLRGEVVWNTFLNPEDSGHCTMKTCVTQIRRVFERRNSTLIGMDDTDNVIESLDFSISVAFNLIVGLFAISIMGIDVTSAWTMITSVVLSLTFIFGSSAADAFRSIVFLFAHTPYNVGDCIILNGDADNMVVERIFLLTSIFRCWTGALITHSNVDLMRMQIQNVTLSSKYYSLNFIHVDGASFPRSLQLKYQADLAVFFSTYKSLYSGDFMLTVRGIDDDLKFRVCLGIEHNMSVVDIPNINRGKTEALTELMRWFVRDGVTFSDPERQINQLMSQRKVVPVDKNQNDSK